MNLSFHLDQGVQGFIYFYILKEYRQLFFLFLDDLNVLILKINFKK
jgi:hypothetical protein